MRILLDHNVPFPLRYALHDHQVETAFERAWAMLLNGELITVAEEAGFDLLITTDRGLRYQQNWSGRNLSLLILSTNDWTWMKAAKDRVLAAVNSTGASARIELNIEEF
jgi:hypothetical protein